MPDWVFWLIFAAVLAAGEVATMGFFLGAVALAALPAAAVAAAGASLTVQLFVFIIGSIASLGFIRPVARRHLHTVLGTRPLHRDRGADRLPRNRARARGHERRAREDRRRGVDRAAVRRG